MNINAYSIYDRKTLAYFPPFYAPADGGAIRSFSDLVSDTSTTVGRHPNDYVLYRVGMFDDTKGAMVPEAPIAHVIDGSALVRSLQQEIPFPESATSPRMTPEERERFKAANGHDPAPGV